MVHRPEYYEFLLDQKQLTILGVTYKIEQIQHAIPTPIIKLIGYNTIEQVRPLVNCEIIAAIADVEPYVLQTGGYFPESWLERNVIDENGQSMGVVIDVIYTGSNDVITVQLDDQEWLVPVISDYILKVEPDFLQVKRPEYA